jgi:hypothetical protein
MNTPFKSTGGNIKNGNLLLTIIVFKSVDEMKLAILLRRVKDYRKDADYFVLWYVVMQLIFNEPFAASPIFRLSKGMAAIQI